MQIFRDISIIPGLGLSGLFVPAISVNMANFSASVHGTVSASLNSIAFLGMFILWQPTLSNDLLVYREHMVLMMNGCLAM